MAKFSKKVTENGLEGWNRPNIRKAETSSLTSAKSQKINQTNKVLLFVVSGNLLSCKKVLKLIIILFTKIHLRGTFKSGRDHST